MSGKLKGEVMDIFPDGAVVKNPPANAGDAGLIPGLGRSPGRENATHFRILAWKIPWTEEPGGLQAMGSQSQTQRSTHTHIHSWFTLWYSRTNATL